MKAYLLIILIVSSFCFSQNWELTTSFPETRVFASSFVLNNEFYIGTSSNSDISTDSFYKFNETTLMWEQIESVPYTEDNASRTDGTAFVINGKAYITGGLRTSPFYPEPADMWEYDPNGSPKWTQKADNPIIPSFQRYMRSFVINGKGYITRSNLLYEYDPTTDTWTQKANYPGDANISPVTFSINGVGYRGTGFGTDSSLNEMYSYNPTTDTWTQVADIPMAFSEGIAFSYNGKGYVGMGINNGDERNQIYAYDPGTNTWEEVNANIYSATSAVAGVTNDYIYIGTGFIDLMALDTIARASTSSLSTSEFTENRKVSVFPNPATEELFIKGFENIELQSYSIIDVNGKLVRLGEFTSDSIDLKGIESGVYFLELDNKASIKFIIE